MTITSSPKTRQRRRVIKTLDGLVRQLVLARDGKCLRCGGTGALTPFHILPKGTYPRLRFELLNVISVCWPCHRYHWHDNPIDGLAWLEQKLPGRIDTLKVLAATANRVDFKELLLGLTIEASNAKSD